MTRVPPVRLTPDFNPGQARFCPEHNRLECTKNRSRGRGQCHGPAIRGLNVCRTHPGLSLAAAKAKGESKITAFSAIGGPANIDYRMAVLGVLQMTWLRLGTYSALLQKQVAAQSDEASALADDPESAEASGLIGFRYGAAGKDGNIFAQSEEIRALVTLEAAERDRVVKYAKTAHDMGISDRLTSLAEKWGDVVATRITVMLDALNLTPEQQDKVPALVQAHLGSIDMEAMGGGPNANGGRKAIGS